MTRLLLALYALLFAAGAAFASVDANTASTDALRTVRGIGPTLAQRIVDERRRGPYKGLDDLQARVRGVGESSLRKMVAAGLTVGPSTVTASASEAKAANARPTRAGTGTGTGQDAGATRKDDRKQR